MTAPVRTCTFAVATLEHEATPTKQCIDRRLTVLRQFFRFVRAQRLVLVDPTKGLSAKESNAFRGRTLTLEQQRALFRRWTTDTDVHPHEALVGMLALLHGASSQEVRRLRADDIDHPAQALRPPSAPHPAGPRQLGRPAALPGSPHQPARHRHQGRPGTRLDRLPQPRPRRLRLPAPHDP
jgi:hypothetical protein